MSKKDEALKLALEALERYQVKRQDFDRFADEITALREALNAPLAEHKSGIKQVIELYDSPEQPAQPVVPDAIHHTDLSESLEYIQGWNDCRAAMFEGKENT